MKRISRLVVVVLALILSITSAQAEGEIFSREITVTGLKEGDIVPFEFPYQISEEHIELENMSFVKYDRGVLYLKANSDIETATIGAFYSEEKFYVKNIHQQGSGAISNRPPSTELAPGSTRWEDIELGKQGSLSSSSGHDYIFSIIFDPYDFEEYDTIYIEDIGANLEEVYLESPDGYGLYVARHTMTEDGYAAEVPPQVDFDLIKHQDGNFVISIKTDDIKLNGEAIKVAVVYKASAIDPSLGVSNKYQIYTNDPHGKKIVGGYAGGESLPLSPSWPEHPSTPSADDGTLKIIKRDAETKDLLPGAHFSIVDDLGNTYSATTDDKGEIFIDNLQYGRYKIIETEPPKGYASSDEPLYISIGVDNRDVEKEVLNHKDNTPSEPELVKPTGPESDLDEVGPKQPEEAGANSPSESIKDTLQKGAGLKESGKPTSKGAKAEHSVEAVSSVSIEPEPLPPTGVSSTLGKIGILLVAAGVIVEAMKCSIKED